MSPLRRQFFLSYAVIGSVMPLMSVFLWREGGLSFRQIGLTMALTNVPMVLMPALITFFADRRTDPRRILAGAFMVSGMVLSMLYVSKSLALTLALFVFHGLAFVAMLPLQDGFYFSLVEHRRRSGLATPPYPRVRVFGTVGFILPSVILFFLIRPGGSVKVILPCAVAFCLLSLANTFTLPRLPAGAARNVGEPLPTLEALRKLVSPEARWLCLALGLSYIAMVSYYTFMPIYFRGVIGVEERHIGLIINLGVLIEIGFTVFMPAIQQRLRLKGIMVVGMLGTVLRMALLAACPTIWTAILTQVVHGMEVLALFIAPVMFLNRLAGDRFRNSIQGVFTMIFGGLFRVAGSLSAGWIAERSLTGLLVWTSALVFAAMLVILFLFKRIPDPRELESGGDGEGNAEGAAA